MSLPSSSLHIIPLRLNCSHIHPPLCNLIQVHALDLIIPTDIPPPRLLFPSFELRHCLLTWYLFRLTPKTIHPQYRTRVQFPKDIGIRYISLFSNYNYFLMNLDVIPFPHFAGHFCPLLGFMNFRFFSFRQWWGRN